MFRKATKIITAELGPGTAPKASITPQAKARVARAFPLLERVLEINPENWPALWFMGKAHQARYEHAEALECFMRARAINPQQPDVAREAGISAMECGNVELALDSTYAALSLRPRDPGLLSNLALALLFAGRLEEAHVAADDSLIAAPDDPVTQTVGRIIGEVLSGKRPCPRSPAELGRPRALA